VARCKCRSHWPLGYREDHVSWGSGASRDRRERSERRDGREHRDVRGSRKLGAPLRRPGTSSARGERLLHALSAGAGDRRGMGTSSRGLRLSRRDGGRDRDAQAEAVPNESRVATTSHVLVTPIREPTGGFPSRASFRGRGYARRGRPSARGPDELRCRSRNDGGAGRTSHSGLPTRRRGHRRG